MLFSLFLSLLTLSDTSFAACKFKFIHNASELIEFSNDVNNGATYEGYTVYLVADINFNETLSKQFKPIGYYSSENTYGFIGTFDGQGYVVSNLVISSSSLQRFGLFGYSIGATIKNVITDDSCSFTSSYIDTGVLFIFVGGINGYCGSTYSPCFIENSVNMAYVGFSGSATYLYLGGITSCFHTVNYHFYIRGCANYGTIHNYGKATNYIFAGGIVGETWSTNSIKYIQNCLNYGTVKNTGNSPSIFSVESLELLQALHLIIV